MKKIYTVFVASIALLSGCATNVGYVEGMEENFDWADKTPDWKIASDYYQLKNKAEGITYTVYGKPKSTKLNKVDPRIIEHYADALAHKGYNEEEIQTVGTKSVAAGMPEKMYNEWIAESSAYDLAIDLILLSGKKAGKYRSWDTSQKYRVLPAGKTTDKQYSSAMYVIALQEKGWKPEYIAALKEGTICVGMPEAGLFAAWGQPYEPNTYTSAGGTIKQYKYGAITSATSDIRFAHTKNGRVTSWTKF